jgi:2-oxoglutarate dehydrogenase E2 component (dihydrolipoamide succinyltransferase)
MGIPVTMPRMGESVTEGTIERWLVAQGDRVEKDQVLCEVTTDKVDAEISAPEGGVVARILVAQGTTVKVGQELAEIDPQGAAASVPRPAGPAPAAKPARSEPAPARSSAPAAASAAPAREAGPASARATPLARRIAEDRGLPLDDVSGSGPAGRVTKADVLAAAARTPAPSSPPAHAEAAPIAAPQGSLLEFLANMRVPRAPLREEDRVIPFSAIRRRIAEHMVVSKVVSPHVGTVAEVDLHRLVALRAQHKDAFAKEHGFALTYLPFVVAATVRGLKQFARLNSTVVDQSIVERAGIHVGVAVETERGLVVPVIRDAARLSLAGLALAIEDLARRARDRELSADDLQGGTFTISNPGRQGNLYGFAVINQPQVGILRMGEIKKRPVVVERDGEDVIAIRPMMYLALSYDHRIIDGVTGNGFLHRVGRELEAAEFEL